MWNEFTVCVQPFGFLLCSFSSVTKQLMCNYSSIRNTVLDRKYNEFPTIYETEFFVTTSATVPYPEPNKSSLHTSFYFYISYI